VLALVAACNASPRPTQENMMADPMLKVRNTYLGLIAKAQADEFRAVPTTGPQLVDRALFASVSWCMKVFRVPVHQPGDDAEHSYHVARPTAPTDLLLHRLKVDAVPVRVYEASSFFAVFVPAATMPASDSAAKAAHAANLLLALPGPAAFKPITADPAQRSYSTDPELPAPAIGDWKRRIDAVALGEDLALVVYKMTYDDMMTFVSDPSNWFEDLRAPR
jgi:hypothetical protein